MIEIIQPPQIHSSTKGEILAIHIPKALLGHDWENNMEFFLDTKELKAKKIKKLDLNKLKHDVGASDNPGRTIRRYFYAPDGVNSLVHLISHHDRETQDAFSDEYRRVVKPNALEILKRNDFDPQHLYYLDYSSYLIYAFREKNPLSRPYYIHYIGGIDNEGFDLTEAQQILKANDWVSHIKLVDIPYYNQEPGRTQAVEFTVSLPQNEYDKLVTYFRDEKQDKFWTCRIKDVLGHACKYYDGIDPLGLKAAAK